MPNPAATPDLDALLEHGGWVRALARSLVQDPDLADDVEQQTWLTAMQHPPAHGKNLRAWLGSVVRSVAGTHWRADKARRRRESVVGERQVMRELQPDARAQPESLAERMDTFRQLAGALSELEEPYGTTLYLRYFEELPVREVARRMQVPEATAQTRIARGLKMLRSRLAHTLGSDWRQRCLVFTLPLAKAPWLGPAVVLAMTTKTKILLGAACVALISLLTVKPWEVGAPADMDSQGSLQAALSEDSTEGVTASPGHEPAIARADLPSSEMEYGPAAAAEGTLELVVQVLDASTLEPVSGVELLSADYTKHRKAWSKASREEFLDDEQLLERFGSVEVLGEDGLFRVPYPEDKVILGARVDRKFAYYFHHPDFHEPGTPVEMLLAPVVEQEVLVVDERGAPVEGAIVGFGASPLRHADGPNVLQQTDREGRAVLRHLEIKLRHDLWDWANTVALMMPSVDPQVVELANEELGREVLRFVTSPWGEVRVHCRYRDGTPIKDGMPVSLQADTDANDPEVFERDMARGLLQTYVKDGLAVFPRVGIGTQVQVASYDRSLSRYMVTVGAGPSRVDDTVDLELVFPDPAEKLTLRLVSPLDVPREAGWMHTWITYLDPSTGKRIGTGQSVYLDDAGLMEIETGAVKDAGGGTLRLQVTPQDSGIGNTGVAPFAIEDLDLAQALEAGEALEISYGGSTVVAGMVVDREGQPVQGFSLRLSMEDLTMAEGSPGRIFNYIEVETGPDGGFRFAGPAGNTRFGYVLTRRSGTLTRWGFAEEIPFDPGDEDLVLSVPGGGKLAGRVLLDDMEWCRNLVVVAHFTLDQHGNQRGSSEIQLEFPNGRFEVEPMSDALVKLELRQPRGSEVLASLDLAGVATNRIDGVEHLPDWDLRGALVRHEIQLRTLDGTPLDSVTCVPGFGTLPQRYFPGDLIVFLSTRDQLDLEIWSEGYRSERVVFSGEAEVVLRRGVAVRISLPDGVDLPAGSRWSLGSLYLGGEGGHRKDLSEALGDAPEALVHLPHPGTWVLKLEMQEDAVPPGMESSWYHQYPEVLFEGGEPWFMIEVEDVAQEQAFVLPVTQEAIEAGRLPRE